MEGGEDKGAPKEEAAAQPEPGEEASKEEHHTPAETSHLIEEAAHGGLGNLTPVPETGTIDVREWAGSPSPGATRTGANSSPRRKMRPHSAKPLARWQRWVQDNP